MSINTASLKAIEDALDSAAEAISDAITEANEDAPRIERGPGAIPPGVYGVESNKREIIEAVLLIAQAVGQPVKIDYVDTFGADTYARTITVVSFAGGGERVVATDEFRDGETRQFRLAGIRRVRS